MAGFWSWKDDWDLKRSFVVFRAQTPLPRTYIFNPSYIPSTLQNNDLAMTFRSWLVVRDYTQPGSADEDWWKM
jgi:hypothetical protein